MSRFLALDQGTSSSRALVFDADGRVLAAAQREFSQYFPQPGRVEHDAAEILATQFAVAKQVLDSANLAPRDVTAIGITNQRETTILWERASGRAVAPAIVWQDRRTAPLCANLKAQGEEKTVRDKTGLLLDPYFSATKIAWLLSENPDLRRRAEAGELAFGTVDCWLVWHLTEGRVHATDVTNASRTLLFDIRRLEWDDELLRLFDVPRALLPEVRPSTGKFGATRAFGGEIAIAGVAGDQQAALVGQACLKAGAAKNTYGTGAFVVMNTGSKAWPCPGLLATVAYRFGEAAPAYAMEGSIFVAGAAVQWLRDGLGIIRSAEEVEALAASVPDSGGVTFVPALAGLGAPFWDAHARGTILGLTRGTTTAHLARATLEAIALRTRDATEAMTAATGEALCELRADGGAARDDLLMQIQADLLGVPVIRPQVTQTTAFGAAMLAAIGAGVLAPDDLAKIWREERRFEPRLDQGERDRRYAEWQRACERARGWADAEAT